MGIITTTQLSNELPSGYTTAQLTTSVNQASRLVNTWSKRYDEWPDESDTVDAPDEIQRVCVEVAKITYFMLIGQENRDGNEGDSHIETLKFYKGYLNEIDVEPEVLSVAISLDSNGVQLIARHQHILRFHPECYVDSAESPANIWNQGYHWDIRKGTDSEEEYIDGWYFDAETYEDTIEGTLYYARSWRNDGLDYQKYRHKQLSQDT